MYLTKLFYPKLLLLFLTVTVILWFQQCNTSSAWEYKDSLLRISIWYYIEFPCFKLTITFYSTAKRLSLFFTNQPREQSAFLCFSLLTSKSSDMKAVCLSPQPSDRTFLLDRRVGKRTSFKPMALDRALREYLWTVTFTVFINTRI